MENSEFRIRNIVQATGFNKPALSTATYSPIFADIK